MATGERVLAEVRGGLVRGVGGRGGRVGDAVLRLGLSRLLGVAGGLVHELVRVVGAVAAVLRHLHRVLHLAVAVESRGHRALRLVQVVALSVDERMIRAEAAACRRSTRVRAS